MGQAPEWTRFAVYSIARRISIPTGLTRSIREAEKGAWSTLLKTMEAGAGRSLASQ